MWDLLFSPEDVESPPCYQVQCGSPHSSLEEEYQERWVSLLVLNHSVVVVGPWLEQIPQEWGGEAA